MIARIEAGNAAPIAPHRRSGFEAARRSREVGRKFGRRLDLVFMRSVPSGPARPEG